MAITLQTETYDISTAEFIKIISKTDLVREPKKKDLSLVISYMLDLSFQSPSRWEDSNRKEFLYSHMHGMNLSVFLYCDTNRCLEALVEHGFDTGDIDYDYFLRWKESLLNIDSNNRSITLIEAYNNNVAFPKGSYSTMSGQPIRLAKDTYYKDLPKALQDVFNRTNVLYRVIVQATNDQLKTCFLAINNNKALNKHEIRQASLAVIADVVRGSMAKYEKVITNFFSSKDHLRRLSDETMAQIYILGAIGVEGSLNSNVLDRAYGHKYPAPNPNVQDKLRKVTNEFLPMLFDMANKLPLNSKAKENNGKSALINLAMVLAELRGIYSKKVMYDITDRAKFVEIFFDVEKKLRASKVMVLESSGAAKTFNRICGASSSENLLKRRELLLQNILTHKNIGKVLVERLVQDEERPISIAVRYELWLLQGEKCRKTGKVIPFAELLNTDMWQVDHIVPVTRGGTNDIDNLQLIDAKANMSMGNKLKTVSPLKSLQAA
jgi:hypothetical protein